MLTASPLLVFGNSKNFRSDICECVVNDENYPIDFCNRNYNGYAHLGEENFGRHVIFVQVIVFFLIIN